MVRRPPFFTVMSSLFPSTQIVPRPQLTASYDVDLALGDFSEVTSQESYWNACPVPHLLTGSIEASSTPPPSPPGSWTIHSQLFKHSNMGGSTDGIHRLMLFVPTSCSTPLHTVKQPWIPLQAALQTVTSAPPAAAPQAPEAREAQVYQDGSDILPFGLFPASRLTPYVPGLGSLCF